MEFLSDNQWAAFAGLLGGAALGLSASIGRFCTLGAIEDALYANDYRRLRMWSLALAVAITGVFSFQAMGLIDISPTMHFTLKWNPLASIVGGLMFGWGMAIAGNCGFGALSRMAGGDIRSFFTVVIMSISAYMALGGPTAALRNWAFPPELAEGPTQSIAHLIGGWLNLPPLAPALAISALAAAWAFSGKRFRKSPTHIIWSIVVGLAILSGWWATSTIAAAGFDPVTIESHSYSAPLGETLLYVMTWTGSAMNFGTGSVIGVLLGAFVGAKIKNRFRWEACDDARELHRSVFGAFLMGTGGVVALGCSIGQGLTAMSALAYSAPVVMISIFIGVKLGLQYLIHGFHRS